MTTLGRWLLGVAVASGALGLLTGWVEWWAVGVAGVVLVLLAVLQALGSFHYRMDLGVAARRVVVGEPGRIDVEVVNTGRRRAWPVVMEVSIGSVDEPTETTTATLPTLVPGAGTFLDLDVPTDRRRVLTIGPVTMVRADVLGLIRREVVWPVSERVHVHPRTVRTEGALAGFVRDLDGTESTVRTDSDLAFHSLREYVPGDDRRHVHWRKTARAGTLLVREYLQTLRSMVVVTLSTDPADYGGDEEFELAVSAAASVTTGLVRAGRPVVCVAGSLEITGPDPGAILDRFTALRPRDGAGITVTTRSAVRRFPQLSLLVPVHGTGAGAAAVRLVHRSRPPGTQVLGLRACRPDHDVDLPPLVDTLTVRDLDLLPRQLRAVSR